MAWIISAILLLLLIWSILIARRFAHKLNILNEYTQFLLFHPKVYEDHRKKFGNFLKSLEDKDPTNQAMMSYQVTEWMALQLGDKILLANVVKRANPEDM